MPLHKTKMVRLSDEYEKILKEKDPEKLKTYIRRLARKADLAHNINNARADQIDRLQNAIYAINVVMEGRYHLDSDPAYKNSRAILRCKNVELVGNLLKNMDMTDCVEVDLLTTGTGVEELDRSLEANEKAAAEEKVENSTPVKKLNAAQDERIVVNCDDMHGRQTLILNETELKSGATTR